MVIRPTNENDLPHIASLTNHFIRTSAIHFALEEQTTRDVREAWRNARDTHPWLTADLDDQFAGFARSTPWRSRAAYRHTAEVAVYVADHARRRGVARALYTALLDDLRNRGFHTAIAGITLPNDPSVAFHEAIGFSYVATFRQVGRKFDQWHDVAFWQLIL